jgi:hypothetical protein
VLRPVPGIHVFAIACSSECQFSRFSQIGSYLAADLRHGAIPRKGLLTIDEGQRRKASSFNSTISIEYQSCASSTLYQNHYSTELSKQRRKFAFLASTEPYFPIGYLNIAVLSTRLRNITINIPKLLHCGQCPLSAATCEACSVTSMKETGRGLCTCSLPGSSMVQPSRPAPTGLRRTS